MAPKRTMNAGKGKQKKARESRDQASESRTSSSAAQGDNAASMRDSSIISLTIADYFALGEYHKKQRTQSRESNQGGTHHDEGDGATIEPELRVTQLLSNPRMETRPRWNSNDEFPPSISKLSSSTLRNRVFSFITPSPLLPLGVNIEEFDKRAAVLSLVCSSWLDLVRRMRETHTRRKLVLDLKFRQQRARSAIQAQVTRVEATVEHISIVMGTMEQARETAQPTFVPYPMIDEVDCVSIKWNSMFSGVTRLRRLDLTLTAASDAGKILTVVAAACPSMEALLLPLKASSQDDKVAPFITELYHAVESWFYSNGGLRQLRVPWLPDHEVQDLLALVMLYCPNIEYLESHSPVRKTLTDDGPIGLRLFDVSVDDWRAFCERCKNLRELDWAMIPFSQEYLNVFTAKTWCNLTAIRLRRAGFYGANDVPSQPCFTRIGIQFLLDALPSLEVLDLELPFQSTTLISADNLLADVAVQCPRLKIIRIQSPVVATEGARRALLKMPRLERIWIDGSVDKAGSSLLDIVRFSPPNILRHIDIQYSSGSHHAAILNLLRYLDEQDKKSFAHLRLSIQLDRDASGRFVRTVPEPKITSMELSGMLLRIRGKYNEVIKRLYLRIDSVKAGNRRVDDRAVNLLGSEIWINHVEPGRADECSYDLTEDVLYQRTFPE